MFDGRTDMLWIMSKCSTARHAAAESLANVRQPDTRRNQLRMFDGQTRGGIVGECSTDRLDCRCMEYGVCDARICPPPPSTSFIEFFFSIVESLSLSCHHTNTTSRRRGCRRRPSSVHPLSPSPSTHPGIQRRRPGPTFQ
jgi:hypothetical protein